MIKAIFKLIWKRKRRSTLMITEMFVSFLLLFALFTMVVKNVNSYLAPTGFDYKNVWVMKMEIWGKGLSDEQNELTIDQLKKNISAMPDVLYLTNTTNNIPYAQSTYQTTLHYNDLKIQTNRVQTDDNFAKVFDIKLIQGRWYDKTDEGQKEIPVVINQKFKKALFGDENAIGKIIHSGAYKVIGVIENYKLRGEYSEEEMVFFSRFKPGGFEEVFLLKVSPDAGITFEEQLMKTAGNIAKDWTITLEPLTKYRKDMFQLTWIPILIFGGLCCFLVLNIILGLFGILWYNINSRIAEIGLRQSVGASSRKIYSQFVGEMLILTTLGFIPALIIAVQFPILKVFDISFIVYLVAMLSSAIIIYLLVFIASFIPSRYATKIQPAIALHEE